MNPQGLNVNNTILMIEHEAFNGAFTRLYQEGMSLIEDTANYIDGDGKIASRNLSGEAASLYTSEAMRMSTRLMQVASWLLLFRAAREKEMTNEQIQHEKAKVSLNTPSLAKTSPFWHELPENFRNLIALSIRIEDRVRHMDHDIDAIMKASNENTNAVNEQIDLLRTAFSRN